MAKKKRTVELVFGERIMEPGVGVFAIRERYEYVKSIHDAMNAAKTWGELRVLMPPGEFESLHDWAANGGEYLYFDGESYLFEDPQFPRDPSISDPDDDDYLDPEYIRRASDKFEYTSITGGCDGDYPPFLELEQDRFLPRTSQIEL